MRNRFRDDLECFVEDVGFDFVSHLCVFRIAPGGRPNIDACIASAVKFDPDLESITFIAGEAPLAFLSLVDGEWQPKYPISPNHER